MNGSYLCEEMQNSIYALNSVRDFMVGKTPQDVIYPDNLYFLLGLITDKQTNLLEQIRDEMLQQTNLLKQIQAQTQQIM
jgi:hypothetical protein